MGLWDLIAEALPRRVRIELAVALGLGILGGVAASRLGHDDLAPYAAVGGFALTGLGVLVAAVIRCRRKGLGE